MIWNDILLKMQTPHPPKFAGFKPKPNRAVGAWDGTFEWQLGFPDGVAFVRGHVHYDLAVLGVGYTKTAGGMWWPDHHNLMPAQTPAWAVAQAPADPTTAQGFGRKSYYEDWYETPGSESGSDRGRDSDDDDDDAILTKLKGGKAKSANKSW